MGLNERCHHTRIMQCLYQHYKATTYLTGSLSPAAFAWRPSCDDQSPWQVQLVPPSPPALSRCPRALTSAAITQGSCHGYVNIIKIQRILPMMCRRRWWQRQRRQLPEKEESAAVAEASAAADAQESTSSSAITQGSCRVYKCYKCMTPYLS